MADHTIRSTNEIVAGICQIADPAQQRQAIEDFMADRLSLFARLAHGLCRTNSVPPSRYHEDIAAMVAETAWVMLSEALANPASLADAITWEAALYHRARPLVRSYTDKNKATASGMVSARRRAREAAKTKALLRAELGSEPANEAVIEATNARLEQAIKDPARQGLVITEADLQVNVDAPIDEARIEFAGFDDDYVLHPSEGAQVVAETIEACGQQDPLLGKVARLWLADVYTSGGDEANSGTVTFIMRELDLTRGQVRARIREIRAVAMGLLEDLDIQAA